LKWDSTPKRKTEIPFSKPRKWVHSPLVTEEDLNKALDELW